MAFAGATRADRDLRDAFRAIKLMRADLEQTRAENRQLELSVALWVQREAAARETATMREEDFHAKLMLVVDAYEAKIAAHRAVSSSRGHFAVASHGKQSIESSEGSTVAMERPESSSGEEDTIAEDTASGNQFDNDDDQAVVENGCKGGIETEHAGGSGVNNYSDREELVTRRIRAEAGQTILRLQAEIRRLTTELEEQTLMTANTRDELVGVKTDLGMSLEESEQQSADKSDRIEKLTREKQLAEEKHQLLHTELDLLSQGKRELKDQLRVAEDSRLELQRTIDDMRATHQLEVISVQNTHQTERAHLVDEIKALRSQLATASSSDADVVDQIQHELADMCEQLKCRDSEVAKLREELTRVQDALNSSKESHGSAVAELQAKLESFSHTSMILKDQLVEKEEEAARSRVNLREKEEALRASSAECNELRTSLRKAQSECDALQSTLGRQTDEAAAAYLSLERTFQEQETHLSELRARMHEFEDRLKASEMANKHLGQELESSKQELESTRQELCLSQDEASTHRDGLSQSRSRCNELEHELRSISAQLETALSEQTRAARATENMKQELELQLQDAHAANVALSGQLSEMQTQVSVHEQECTSLSMEKKALQQEVRQIKQSAKHAKDEAASLQSRGGELELQLRTLQHEDAAVRMQLQVVCRRLEAAETKAMALEDRQQMIGIDELSALFRSSAGTGEMTRADDGVHSSNVAALPSAAWFAVKRKISELGKFLPHLQTFAVLLDDALCGCESNATTLSVLCAQLEQGDDDDVSTGVRSQPPLLHDVAALVRFAYDLQHLVASRQPEFVKRARRFHRRVFDVMAHWCEMTEDDEIPAPPVAIASREVALILANWTRDKVKRASTRQWLERVEAVGGAGLGTFASHELSPRLDADGTTLVLNDMTSEAKQAFLVLVVPILRRNPAVFVRVFTRLAPPPRESAGVTIAMLEDKRWEMKIHVQPSNRPGYVMPAGLALETASVASGRGLDRPPASPSSVSSTSTSSSATSRLQIIQERLQRMQSH